MTTVGRVQYDHNLAKADYIEVTVSTDVHNDENPYQPSNTLEFKRTKRYRPSPRYLSDLTKDEDQRSSAHVAKNFSENHRVDNQALNLLFNTPRLALMMISGARLRLEAGVRREHVPSNRYPRKRYSVLTQSGRHYHYHCLLLHKALSN